MAGRPRIFNEETALEKASDLFWQKGYEATSTDDLIGVMGLQRGSFYNTFGSKKALFINAINFHEENSLLELKRVLKESSSPIQTLKEIFRSLADCPADEHGRGCFAGNTIAELSGIDEELAEHSGKHLKALENVFYNQVKSSQQSGELKTKTDARLLARYMLNLWNGLNITRRIYPNKRSLLPLIELQLELLK